MFFLCVIYLNSNLCYFFFVRKGEIEFSVNSLSVFCWNTPFFVQSNYNVGLVFFLFFCIHTSQWNFGQHKLGTINQAQTTTTLSNDANSSLLVGINLAAQKQIAHLRSSRVDQRAPTPRPTTTQQHMQIGSHTRHFIACVCVCVFLFQAHKWW